MSPSAMRMSPLTDESMDDAQRAAAQELIAGPRKGVKGPFIALLRSPELMARVQKVGEYLRFNSKVPRRLSEFATLIVSRVWTQQFEWFIHVPLALEAGTSQETIDALRDGRRPPSLSPDESAVFDFTMELLEQHGVSDATYDECVKRFGEQGVVDLTCIVGYFAMISMVLNMARIPHEPNATITPLSPL